MMKVDFERVSGTAIDYLTFGKIVYIRDGHPGFKGIFGWRRLAKIYRDFGDSLLDMLILQTAIAGLLEKGIAEASSSGWVDKAIVRKARADIKAIRGLHMPEVDPELRTRALMQIGRRFGKIEA